MVTQLFIFHSTPKATEMEASDVFCTSKSSKFCLLLSVYNDIRCLLDYTQCQEFKKFFGVLDQIKLPVHNKSYLMTLAIGSRFRSHSLFLAFNYMINRTQYSPMCRHLATVAREKLHLGLMNLIMIKV